MKLNPVEKTKHVTPNIEKTGDQKKKNESGKIGLDGLDGRTSLEGLEDGKDGRVEIVTVTGGEYGSADELATATEAEAARLRRLLGARLQQEVHGQEEAVGARAARAEYVGAQPALSWPPNDEGRDDPEVIAPFETLARRCAPRGRGRWRGRTRVAAGAWLPPPLLAQRRRHPDYIMPPLGDISSSRFSSFSFSAREGFSFMRVLIF